MYSKAGKYEATMAAPKKHLKGSKSLPGFPTKGAGVRLSQNFPYPGGRGGGEGCAPMVPPLPI